MKKIWKYLFLLFSASSSAQITLDNIVTPQFGIGESFYTVQISNAETKYLFEDSLTNTFSLYNMDFTPFMTNIAVPEPFANLTFQVIYVSRSLFDCDSSNIEYAYEASTNSAKTFYIMRTDGTQLFRLDSANGPFCAGGCLGFSDFIRPIRNTSDGTKLFLQSYTTGHQEIFIYSLCGTLVEDVFDFSLKDLTFVSIFPNPSSDILTFKIYPPDNINEFELIIVDNNAREMKREKVNSENYSYVLDASNMSGGTYFYSLCSKSITYQSGKFILTK